MDFKQLYASPTYRIFISGCLLNFAVFSSCFAISQAEINQLETKFQNVTSKIYSSLSQNLSQCRTRARSIKGLNIQLEKLSRQGENIIGICLVNSHLDLIKKNIDSKQVFPVFQFLLDNNHLSIANKLYQQAKNEADQSLVSNISFIYARYFVKRKNWKQVLKHIDGTYNDLAMDDANLARLFTGIALQNLKRHRTAVKIYSKIPQQSRYYPAARLNIATAYIRQDWWTDAHNKINEILTSKKIKTNNEMINRLYLVLGYSLLRKEFYRDSREAFRNIELDSVYFNKALLGIALTATNQEDYVSALNAINILKSKNNYDLSVDEAHLLLPYTYEKLNQNMTASASYTDAKKYFEQRINILSEIKNRQQYNIRAEDIINNNNRVTIEKNTIYFTEHYPASFLENYAQLNRISKYSEYLDSNLKKQYLGLINRHDILLNKMLRDALNQRMVYLKSYMNQSRYGLARLFDNSNKI